MHPIDQPAGSRAKKVVSGVAQHWSCVQERSWTLQTSEPIAELVSWKAEVTSSAAEVACSCIPVASWAVQEASWSEEKASSATELTSWRVQLVSSKTGSDVSAVDSSRKLRSPPLQRARVAARGAGGGGRTGAGVGAATGEGAPVVGRESSAFGREHSASGLGYRGLASTQACAGARSGGVGPLGLTAGCSGRAGRRCGAAWAGARGSCATTRWPRRAGWSARGRLGCTWSSARRRCR